MSKSIKSVFMSWICSSNPTRPGKIIIKKLRSLIIPLALSALKSLLHWHMLNIWCKPANVFLHLKAISSAPPVSPFQWALFLSMLALQCCPLLVCQSFENWMRFLLISATFLQPEWSKDTRLFRESGTYRLPGSFFFNTTKKILFCRLTPHLTRPWTDETHRLRFEVPPSRLPHPTAPVKKGAMRATSHQQTLKVVTSNRPFARSQKSMMQLKVQHWKTLF